MNAASGTHNESHNSGQSIHIGSEGMKGFDAICISLLIQLPPHLRLVPALAHTSHHGLTATPCYFHEHDPSPPLFWWLSFSHLAAPLRCKRSRSLSRSTVASLASSCRSVFPSRTFCSLPPPRWPSHARVCTVTCQSRPRRRPLCHSFVALTTAASVRQPPVLYSLLL